MRVVLLAAALALASASARAQSLDGLMASFIRLTPHQQELVAVAIHSYRMRLFRADGSEVTALTREESRTVLAQEKVCGAAMLDLVARGQLTTSDSIAAENARCLNWEFGANRLPYTAAVDEPR